MTVRIRRIVPAFVLLMAVIGCSGPKLVEAGGRLTCKGKPVPSTLVKFMPEDGGRASNGVTDDDGNFTLRFSKTQSGVLRGKHTVILRYDLSVDEELHRIPPKASKELKAIIAKYGDPEKSPFHYEVNCNGQFFEIEIE